MNKLKQKILYIQNNNDNQSENVLDYIFETINRLLITMKYDIVNDLLKQPIAGYSIDSLVGLLSLTADYQKELNYRNYFYDIIYDSLIEDGYEKKNVDSLLSGLN
jgi:hypothetical protein